MSRSGENDELAQAAAQARRKRGLSLRSQLLNKALASSLNPFTDRAAEGPHSQPDASSNRPSSPPPIITVEEAGVGEIDGLETSEPSAANVGTSAASAVSADKGSPYLVTEHAVSQSTSRLTTSFSNDNYHQKKFRGRRAKASFGAALASLRDKILGSKDVGHTERGRIIPLCVAPQKANRIFGEKFYDPLYGYVDERTDAAYCSNAITSSKYNIYTFLPKQLRAQFSKLANCYFMVVAIMQMIPSWSTTGKFTTLIPVLIFMSISIAREGFDDWKRHGHDKEENNKRTRVVRENSETETFDTELSSIMTETISLENLAEPCTFDAPQKDFSNEFRLNKYNLDVTSTKWQDVKVGDLLLVKENEWIPADLVLLAADNDEDEAFVETMALDGETNLKTRVPHPKLAKKAAKVTTLKNMSAVLTVEDPNSDLYNFEGHFSVDGSNYALGPENIVYRGSILRNTRSVLGLVVFTGEESKIRMNNVRNPRVKAPKLQSNINYIVMFMVVVVLSLAAFSLMAQRLFYNKYKDKMWYVYEEDAGVAATFMGFVIMYNTLIPLSLYVTMEIIKVMQLLFLQYDIDMYQVETNTPADAKTATILEELGQVSYIFSDKTGTLTDNKMLFRKFSVCGSAWLHDLDLLVQEKENPNTEVFPSITAEEETSPYTSPRNSMASLVRESLESNHVQNSGWRATSHPLQAQNLDSTLFLLKYVQSHPNSLFAKRVTFFLLSIALCHTCQPRKEQRFTASRNPSAYSLADYEPPQVDDLEIDSSIVYQAASPDELALIQAARDLGFVVLDKQNNILSVKTYPEGFGFPSKTESYEVLDSIEFTSARKRMSVVVRFPDSRIAVFCKGADNIILELLKNSEMARQKAREISLSTRDRKVMEAEIVLQSKLSQDLESRKSLGSVRNSTDLAHRLASIEYVSKEDQDIHDVADRTKKSLHLKQKVRYSLEKEDDVEVPQFASDKLLVNEEYVMEKTLEHIEGFSSEGLRTLLYSYKWISEAEYEQWATQYHEAKLALYDRAKKIEETGSLIEANLNLLGATAIEDKLQDGVSQAIEKIRRAGIKMWMLTGDKRETAINIGYSCRLIKDYSTVVILTIDEGLAQITQRIKTASDEIKAGRIAHCVVVVDGATLSEIEHDSTILTVLIELLIQVDSAICCRASPSQKAMMINSVREVCKKDVTLAIGDGANDIAMIQSADIGVGITGKEGLQAARSADYAIAQFRFLLKLLLVNGRYNYIRTSKFVLCTFYKELLFYLTQCVYQRYTLFTGSSMYESWSLSMFNTLFTSLPVICIGMFEKDLRPATLLAVPELYSAGRLYKAFNLKVFLAWMFLAALQSVAVSFVVYITWGFTAMRDNTTLPLGTLVFWALVIIINAKCQFLETHNIQWLALASFLISVLGFGLWNVLIMYLHRSNPPTIFYADYGLLNFGADYSWWLTLLATFTVVLLFDLTLKILKTAISPSDAELFRVYEKDLDMRRTFEQGALYELKQSWFFTRDVSTTRTKILSLFNRVFGKSDTESRIAEAVQDENLGSAIYRKRAGTNPMDSELAPGSGGTALSQEGFEYPRADGYEILPSGKRVRVTKSGLISRIRKGLGAGGDIDVDQILNDRMRGLEESEARK